MRVYSFAFAKMHHGIGARIALGVVHDRGQIPRQLEAPCGALWSGGCGQLFSSLGCRGHRPWMRHCAEVKPAEDLPASAAAEAETHASRTTNLRFRALLSDLREGKKPGAPSAWIVLPQGFMTR